MLANIIEEDIRKLKQEGAALKTWNYRKRPIKHPHMKVDLLNKRPFQLNAPFE